MNGLMDLKKQSQNSEILYAKEKRPREFVRVEFDLSESYTKYNPYEISHQFKSMLVESVVGSDAQVYFKPNAMDESQDHLVLMDRDSIAFDTIIGEGFFYWPQQPGKKMTVVFMFSSQFSSGSYTQRSSGSLSITEGATASGTTNYTLVGATPTQILPALNSRKVAVIQNKTGADLFISGSNTVATSGANEGILIADKGTFIWRNTAPLFAVSAAGGRVTTMEET